MYSDMLEWRAHNPPPATMMLISDQVEDVFAWDLARLQQHTQYNLFLASPSMPSRSSVLHTSARWAWESLLLESPKSLESPKRSALSSQLSVKFSFKSSALECTSGQLSAAKFYCKPCCFHGQSPAGFRKHISSKMHAVKEVLNPLYEELDSQTSKWGKNYAAKPEYATAQIAVWWDMIDCPIPEGYDARRVRPSLEAAFKELGYSGPVSITAFGDLNQAPDHLLRGLSSTGVALAHAIPEVIYSRMLSAMATWKTHNPPPATIMFISDDLNRLYSDTIAREQQENKYNLFMAYSYRPHKMSVLVTSAEWLWESLLLAGAPRWGLHKCSQSSTIPRENTTEMFVCRVCICDCKSLDDFTNHLSSENHAQEEAYIYACRRAAKFDIRYRIKDEVLENFPESKRLRKACGTGFGHLHNHLHVVTNRGSRLRARKSHTSKKDW
ncbi:hypothetical protein EUTSA_v10000121mg [Eutrema salsugineum]|nr:hypothetical protein EUTSA_v10000121mg [Eutrema salsugineum]